MFLKRTVITNGIPFSMVLEESYDAIAASQAMKNMNAQAKASGASEMTLEEINEEIAAARRDRWNNRKLLRCNWY